MNCVFCNYVDKVLENDLATAFYDLYPASPGHLLIIPKRHVSSFFETTDEEKLAIFQLIDDCRKLIQEKYNPDSYNIGVNVGIFAGQTIMHAHVHVIPRYVGDVMDPRGGIRGVIPEKRVSEHP